MPLLSAYTWKGRIACSRPGKLRITTFIFTTHWTENLCRIECKSEITALQKRTEALFHAEGRIKRIKKWLKKVEIIRQFDHCMCLRLDIKKYIATGLTFSERFSFSDGFLIMQNFPTTGSKLSDTPSDVINITSSVISLLYKRTAAQSARGHFKPRSNFTRFHECHWASKVLKLRIRAVNRP